MSQSKQQILFGSTLLRQNQVVVQVDRHIVISAPANCSIDPNRIRLEDYANEDYGFGLTGLSEIGIEDYDVSE